MSGSAYCTAITTIALTRPVSFEPTARIRAIPWANSADPGSQITARPLNR